MNKQLWNKILAFDFDNPPSEYGFSTRLANENFWTKEFTTQAILEYKKFMYLAATSDAMVSPSEIIDTVWHQHLIFTQSYQGFCDILGKQIQHIPSTHNKEDFGKFRQAKERTIRLYERDFGKQPKCFWEFDGMFQSLNLEKAPLKLRTFILFGILAFMVLTVPAYFLLKPIYILIHNPHFILGLIALTVSTLFALEFYNKAKLNGIVSGFDPSSFVYHLHPFELVHLKTQQLSNVINGAVNELIADDTIKVNSDSSIELAADNTTNDIAQIQIISALSELGTTFYPNLLKTLETKPIFRNIANSSDAFKKYINKSKKFGTLFYTNFAVLTVLLLFSFTRIVTGILRDKPVVYIVIVTVILAFVAFLFLQRLTIQLTTTTIPNLYKTKIIPTRQVEEDWQWTYFLLGSAVLTTSFIPLTSYADRNGSGSSCGTSSGDGGGSSCGSSCSSCGGCGG